MEKENHLEQYQLHKEIGKGSFGTIFQAELNGSVFAIKTQTISTVKPMVILQYQIFKELHQIREQERMNAEKGIEFPEVFEYGQKEHFSYLVMERLDCTLQDLVNIQLQNQVPKDVLLIIMYNTLKGIKKLHEIGYVYRDVKPSNFMIKKSDLQNEQGKIYLIDLGLCKRYLKENHEHIRMKTNKKMIGTAIFCSKNTHKGFQTSRRDDIQSWIYMISYLVKKLPWEDYSNRKQQQFIQTQEAKQASYEKIGKIKQNTNIGQLTKGDEKLPFCLQKIYQSLKDLQFESRPNYESYFELIQEEYNKLIGSKTPLAQIPFRIKTEIDDKKQKQRKNIKINFKIPLKKKGPETNEEKVDSKQYNN